MEHNYESGEEDFRNETKPFLRKKVQEKPPLWDSFQDIPEPKSSGSAANQKKFDTFMKCLKCVLYVFVFLVILFGSIVSKLTLLLMTAHIRPDTVVRYCDKRYPYKELIAVIPEVQQIFWIWALIFSFSAPEIFTFFRSLRIFIFKNFRSPGFTKILLIGIMETLHVIGLSVFIFVVLPEFSSLQGLMLTNCVSFLPALLGLISACENNFKSIFKITLSALAVITQLTGFFTWPLTKGNPKLVGLTIVALLFISFKWWENYISGFSYIKPLVKIANLRKKLSESRYHIYLYVSPWKILVFTLMAFLLNGRDMKDYFSKFTGGWVKHEILIKESSELFSDRKINNTNYQSIEYSSQWAHIGILIIHIIASYLCYIFSKFACKIKIQKFSFSCPLTISVPASFVCITILSGLREANTCIYNGYFPNYLSFKDVSIYNLTSNIINNFIWIWILWWLSQIWITRHIWFPENDKNASTEKLFISPFYCSFLIDQCISLNRRRLDKEDFVILMDVITYVDPEIITDDPTKINMDVRPGDKIPQLIVCATMWHENEDEMIEFLKSILRLDNDQCARRMAKKNLPGNHDEEYYELESHIFFDDAFITKCVDPDNCKNPNCIDLSDPPINTYVETLISSIEKAAYKVYNVRITIKPPVKIETPYGGRLIWTLPGRTKLITHLKNIKKIRNKKRWSQVMYMYYLLGYRIMEMDASPQRKTVIANNTFLLALDGDIDFQPKAVQLLISRMKVNPMLGAVCGRIHPIGKGPMVWFQIFEYAIGHWLQKATEHVIGCVLCSPGCFSLFRGLALIHNSVIKKYSTVSTKPRHYIQYDQGEDRWLCTLLLKQEFQIEYSAASDAYTHSPEGFSEFYKQRRRWIPSTMANILDLLGDAKSVVKKNNSISMLYIIYQGMLMLGNILGPGTIFLMMIGSFVTVFNIDLWTSFLWNFFPVLFFMIICYFCNQDFQIMVAFVISTIYSFVMMAVLIGVAIQIKEDGVFSPVSIFFIIIVLQIIITATLHPQEFLSVFFGIIYFITIPSMYLLLMIYSIFNMNDNSWGTRETIQNQNGPKIQENTKQTGLDKFFGTSTSNKNEEGFFDFSFGNVFRCSFCTHPKSDASEVQLLAIRNSLNEINSKLVKLETKTSNITNVEENKKNEEVPVTITVENKKVQEHPPGWSSNKHLENCTLESLSFTEKLFWEKFITKYLKPLEKTKKEKEEVFVSLEKFRNNSAFAFVMFNSLFVLIVFLLQLKKNYLHIIWPFNVNNTIQFDETTFEVKIYRNYLQLDPIGLVLVILFGIILVIQFLAMLIHRLGTISQILATTELNWNLRCGKSNNEIDQQKGTFVELAKYLQRPEEEDQNDDDDDDENEQKFRKSTIHKIHLVRERKTLEDWSNLEKNFERRFLQQNKKLNYGNIPLSRKSIKLIDEKRKTIINAKKEPKLSSQDESKYMNSRRYGGYENNGYVSDEK